MIEPQYDMRELNQLANAAQAVARNISNFTNDERERILLAAAVLYGIVKPLPPRVRKPRPKKPKRVGAPSRLR